MENPRLPDWIQGITETKGRPSASSLNNSANTSRDKTLTVAANGALVPIIYGRASVAGLIFAIGTLGTDLVVGYVWGIGEIEEIEDVYINDEVAPVAVTITNYTGTPTQGVDPTLASAIPAYADTMRIDTPNGKRGIAYSVIRVPTGELSGFPRARAVVKGRKVYDPRTLTTAYSDNPSLCFADMVTDSDYGLNSEVTSGLAECADWNDSLLGGVSPRARLSLVIMQGRKVEDYLTLLAEYAECWYSYEGAGVKMTPDSLVDLSTVDTYDNIIQGSISIQTQSSVDTPTEVEVRYTVPVVGSEPWLTESTTQSLSGVATGDVPRVPTTISLEGVYRLEEANNKALARLNRMQNRVSVSWQTFDAGVIFQKGDVVKINNPARGYLNIPVRIMKVSLVAAGRYQVSGERYDASHYPSEIDTGEDGTVPEGVIGLLSGDTVPSGWELFTAADGKFIMAASATNPVGSSGGSSTFAGFTGTSGANPSHIGDLTYSVIDYTPSAGSEVGYWFNTNTDQAGHFHTFSTGVVTPNLYRRENRLVKKISGGSVKIPANILSFGLDGIVDGDAVRITNYSGRLLKSSPTDSNQGVVSENVSVSLDAFNDIHNHDRSFNSGLLSTIDFSNEVFFPNDGGGLHTHSASIALQRLIKKYPLALYGGINDYSVKAGRMFLWSGDINNPPTDWVVVETIKDHFIEIAGGTTNPPSGDNTLKISGTSSNVGHSHQGVSSIVYKKTRQIKHSDTVVHNHSIDATSSWIPPYYCLAVIMYQPVD